MIDHNDGMLEVYHTDDLRLGDNNGDFTISFDFLQTVETFDYSMRARNLIYKGDYLKYRDI